MRMIHSSLLTGARWPALAFLLTLALGAAACSGQNANNFTSPSSVGSSQGNHGGTPTVRYFKASITPTSVATGSSNSFSVTVTNCSAATCDASHVTSSQQTIKSISVTIPAGFTVNAASLSAPAGWNASVVAGSIQLAKTGNTNIGVGQSLTFSFSATAPATCASYEWTTAAFNGENFETPYDRFGSQPSVTVTNCPTGGCTYTQGYWKTHGPVPTGNNSNEWPVTSLTLGSVNYTDTQLLSILNTPAAGNGLIALAHQLIAAKLNIANGADGTAVAAAITAADALIGSLVVPPVGSGSLHPNLTSALTDTLTGYNEGATGPGHCN